MTEDINAIISKTGAIIVNFNGLELAVRRLLWWMVNSHSPEMGQAVTKALTTDKIEELGYRILKDINYGLFHEQIAEIFDSFKACRVERNEIAHQYLMVKNEDNRINTVYRAWPQHYKRGTFYSNGIPVTIQEMSTINQKILDTQDSVWSLLEKTGVGQNYGNT